MRKVLVSKLVPGMRLARRILGIKEEVYLQAGVILTPRYIQRLKELGFTSVFVYDTRLEHIELPKVDDVISEQLRYEAVCGFQDFLWELRTSQRRAITAPVAMVRLVNSMVNQVLDNHHMYNLVDIRSDDEYLYHHSVNVCVLSLIVGTELGFKRDELMKLGIGALFHDVGKIKVPMQVLHKPGKLTAEEYEIVKKHALYTEELLKNDPTVADFAGKHHERLNGEGYPYGLKKGHIPVFAQIIGLVDMYDALTADRCYRAAYQPHETLEMLAATGDYWFSYKIVRAFMANVAAYPVGTVVELQSREIGVVLETPKGLPYHPIIRVFLSVDKGWISEPYDISTLDKGLSVIRVLDDEEISYIRSKYLLG